MFIAMHCLMQTGLCSVFIYLHIFEFKYLYVACSSMPHVHITGECMIKLLEPCFTILAIPLNSLLDLSTH